MASFELIVALQDDVIIGHSLEDANINYYSNAHMAALLDAGTFVYFKYVLHNSYGHTVVGSAQ